MSLQLFYKLEGLVQEFLTHGIPAEFRVDGSFLTEEEVPGDVDIAIKVMDDVMQSLTPEQDTFLTKVASDDPYIQCLDTFVFACNRAIKRHASLDKTGSAAYQAILNSCRAKSA